MQRFHKYLPSQIKVNRSNANDNEYEVSRYNQTSRCNANGNEVSRYANENNVRCNEVSVSRYNDNMSSPDIREVPIPASLPSVTTPKLRISPGIS